MTWRYLAQRALTGEWLDTNLPLANVKLTYQLSGPDTLAATISPERAQLIADDGSRVLDEWGTYLYAEEEGVIRAGAILTRSSFDGPQWQLDATGFAGYPTGIPYLGEYTKDSVDPLDVVREIWTHLQGQPDGDLGLVVDADSSPVRIGKNPKHTAITPDSGGGESAGDDAKPYRLVWWEAPYCGQEIDNLAKQTPFDYHEEHAWDGEQIAHRIRLHYPRLGRRQTNLRFVLGENLSAMPQPSSGSDEFANEGYGVGKGKGRKALHVRVPQRDGRLRRCHVITKSGIGDRDRLTRLVRADVAQRSKLLDLSQVTVADHSHARLGSFGVGDDIRVQAELPWIDLDLWCRITSYTVEPDNASRATLTLARSDSFTYGEVHT